MAEAAEVVWEEEWGGNIFTYDPDAEFGISLIYDERQARTDARINYETQINEARASIRDLVDELESKKSQFETFKDGYESDQRTYLAAQKNLNQKIQQINERGGATPQEAQEINREQNELARKSRSLEQKRIQVNQQVGELNQESEETNKEIAQFNENIRNFNEEFSKSDQFNQGIYNRDGIEIYQFESGEDLVAVLVHEFGHALGIPHVEDPDAVMYFLQHEGVEHNLNLTQADRDALFEVCPQ